MAIEPAGRGPQLCGVVGFFLALSTVAIMLRAYCRAFLVKSFGVDDWFVVVAYIFFVFFCGFAITGVYHGTGQHAQDIIPPTEIPIGLKWWWACEPVYVLSNMALKFSIGWMLLRLTFQKSHKIIIWITLAITEIYGTFFFFLFVLQCRPSSYFWTQYTGGKGTCINPRITVDATYAYSALWCAGDWIFATIPVFLVWNLQMNPRTKISVIVILAMGAIASAATIVRIPYVRTLSNQADFLYATTDVAIWSCVETGIGIAACSLATLRPLFRAFFSRSGLLGGTGSHTTSNQWPRAARPSGRYIQSRCQAGTRDEFSLRNGVGKHRGVTTTIECDINEDDSENRNLNSRSSERHLRNKSDGDISDAKLTGIRSSREDDLEWATGIRKVTISHQVVQ